VSGFKCFAKRSEKRLYCRRVAENEREVGGFEAVSQ
jgi:hypothetical protein